MTAHKTGSRVQRAVRSSACCWCRFSAALSRGTGNEARRGERGHPHQQARLHAALDDRFAGERRRRAVRRVLRRERADRPRLDVAPPARQERQRRAAGTRAAGARRRIDPLRQGRIRREHAEEQRAGGSEDARSAVAGPLRRRGRGRVRRARGSGPVRRGLSARPQRRIDPRLVGGHREAGRPALRRPHQPVRALALAPGDGDRTDPCDAHQGGGRRGRRGQRDRGLSRRDAGLRTHRRPICPRSPRPRACGKRRTTRCSRGSPAN